MRVASSLRLRALATDFDGTLAHDGTVPEQTIAALKQWKAAGLSLILVTGRELNDLRAIFADIDLFDVAVMENGAVIFHPVTGLVETIAPAPPAEFIARLYERGLPLHIGNSIVATWEPYQKEVEEVIAEMNLDLQVILNKDAVMILPRNVDKATGLKAALRLLALDPAEVAGVGDAENDYAFLQICGYSAAVANALPAIKESVHYVTAGSHGEGVAELIERLLNQAQSAA